MLDAVARQAGARRSTTRTGPGRCPEPWAQAQTRRDVLLAHWPVGARRARPPAAAGACRSTRSTARRGSGSSPAGSTALRVRGPAAAARALVVAAARGVHLRHARRPPGRLALLGSNGEAARSSRRRSARTGCPPTGRGSSVGPRGSVRRVDRDGLAFRRALRRPTGGAFTAGAGDARALPHRALRLYTADGGRLYRAELHHAPWRLRRADGDGRGGDDRAASRSTASRTRSRADRRTCSSGRSRS